MKRADQLPEGSEPPPPSLTGQSRSLADIYLELGTALLRVGHACEQAGDLTQASRRFRTAVLALREGVTEGPDRLDLLVMLADAYDSGGSAAEAFQTYVDVARRDPARAPAVLPRAEALLSPDLAGKLGDVDAQLSSGATDTTSDERRAIESFLGWAALHGGEPGAALTHFRRAVAEAPDDVRVLSGLGEALRLTGEVEAASHALEQALAQARAAGDQKLVAQLCMDLARAYVQLRRWSEAQAALQDAVTTDFRLPLESRILLSRIALATGQPHLAVIAATEALSDPQATLAIRRDAQICLSQGFHALAEFERAAKAADDALRLDSRDRAAMRAKLRAQIDGDIDVESTQYLLDLYGQLPGPEADANHFRAKFLRKLANTRAATGDDKAAIDYFATAESLVVSDDPQVYWDWAEEKRLQIDEVDPAGARLTKQEGLRLLELGFKRGRPTNSRPYFTRSMLRDPEADWETQSWEGIAFAECALLLDDAEPANWAALAISAAWLGVGTLAMDASARALELSPDADWALATRVMVYEYAGPRSAAVDLMMAHPDQWSEPVVQRQRAFDHFLKARYAEALRALPDNEEPATLSLRANLLRRLDENEQAMAIYRQILEVMTGTPDDSRSAEACFFLALRGNGDDAFFDRAKQTYADLEQHAENVLDACDAYLGLGLVYLGRGDWAEGERWLSRAISNIPLWMLDQGVMSDIGYVESALTPNEGLAAMIERLRGAAHQRMAEVSPNSAVEALERVVAPPGSIAAIGALAGRGRMYLTAQQWHDAASAYAALLDAGQRFPEAQRGLDRALEGWLNSADLMLKADQVEAAAAEIDRALLLAQRGSAHWRALLLASSGYTRLRQSDPTAARRLFLQAIAVDATWSPSAGGQSVGAHLATLVSDGDSFWSVLEQWRTLIAEAESDETSRDLDAAHQAFLAGAELLFRATPAELPKHAVSPIEVVLGDALIPAETSLTGWTLFNKLLPEMRARLQQTMGLQAPGVSVRDGLPNTKYRIFLDEVLVASGETQPPPAFRYSPSSPEQLRALGIPDSELVPQPNPETGALGCWVGQRYWDQLIGGGIELWSEALEFVIRHVQRVLERHAPRLLNVDVMEVLLADWSRDENLSDLLAAVAPDPAARRRLGRVLSLVVEEGVSLNHIGEMLGVLRTIDLARTPTHAVVTQLRRGIADVLQPVDSQHFSTAPSDWDQCLSTWLRPLSGDLRIVTPIEPVQQLQLQMADWLREHRSGAVVSLNGDTRRYLRRLLQREAPEVTVLAADELRQNMPTSTEPGVVE